MWFHRRICILQKNPKNFEGSKAKKIADDADENKFTQLNTTSGDSGCSSSTPARSATPKMTLRVPTVVPFPEKICQENTVKSNSPREENSVVLWDQNRDKVLSIGQNQSGNGETNLGLKYFVFFLQFLHF